MNKLLVTMGAGLILVLLLSACGGGLKGLADKLEEDVLVRSEFETEMYELCDPDFRRAYSAENAMDDIGYRWLVDLIINYQETQVEVTDIQERDDGKAWLMATFWSMDDGEPAGGGRSGYKIPAVRQGGKWWLPCHDSLWWRRALWGN